MKTYLTTLMGLCLAAPCSLLAEEAPRAGGEQTAPPYMFVGTYKPRHANGGFQCSDSRLVAKPAATKEEANAHRLAFNAETPLSSYRHIDLFVPERHGMVIQYQKRHTLPTCESTSLHALQGNDQEDLQRKLAEFEKEYAKYLLTRPTVAMMWEGSGLRTTTSEVKDNVEIRYRAGKSAGGKAVVHAQVINHNTDKTAIVLFRVNNAFGDARMRLGPGVRGGQLLGKDVAEFGAAVVLVTPEEADRISNDSLINRVKGLIRSQVVKDGQIDVRSSPPAGSGKGIDEPVDRGSPVPSDGVRG